MPFTWMFRLPVLLVLASLFLVSPDGGSASAEGYSRHKKSPYRLTIKLKKETFKVGEPLEGTVVVDNRYPASLPGNFDVRLFRGGKEVYQTNLSIERVPLGKMEFALRKFGVPQFNRDPGSEGPWTIRIRQQGADPDSAVEAIVTIIPDPEAERAARNGKKKRYGSSKSE